MPGPESATDPQHAMQRISDACIGMDLHGRVSFANAAACELAGCTEAELVGTPLEDQIPQGIDGALRRAVESALAEQVADALEVYCPSRERWFENRIYPAPDGVTIQILDITRRKRVERDRADNQRMLLQAQDVAHVGSWEWNMADNTVAWSRQLYRIYGLTPEQHAPTFEGYLALVHAQDRERVKHTVETAARDLQPFEFEERILRPDGSVRMLLSRGIVDVDEARQPVRMLGVCQDITERKRSEQLDEGQQHILACIAAQKPLAENLEQIARLHELLNPGALCSVQLLDDAGTHILDGAAPSLPKAYSDSLHGLEIGDARGSCGTAAWRRERIVVADIATHPYWEDYRDAALQHGLKACWSTPVLGSDGRVLGTFAVYYHEAREPRPSELQSIDRMVPIAAIAIESANLVENLRERNRFFDMSKEIFCIIDPQSERLVQSNPSLSRVTGYSAEELKSASYHQFLQAEAPDAGDNPMLPHDTMGNRQFGFVNRCLCKDGSERLLEWVSFAAPNGQIYAVARDITERRRVEAQLAHASSHDAVTGLQHHLILRDKVVNMLKDPAQPVSVLSIGLDRFQIVNESVGHATGDDVLRRLAMRLRSTLGDAGGIARFASDRFVVVTCGLQPEQTRALAERLRAAVAVPVEGDDYRLLITASVGISHAPQHGNDPKNLLRRADTALAQAKRVGRDQISEFSHLQMRDIEDRLMLGSHLRNAIELDELSLHFQPQFRAIDQALTGFETLLRWNCHQLGSVAPSRFIPIAEALGLMPEIGEWVLDAACRQARKWLDHGHRDFTIAVNISAQQLQRPGLVAQVTAALQRHKIPASMLDLEMTESSLMENVERIHRILAELKALGTQLSLDDFGTGYSSLAYLKYFPIDKLKIDQRFVSALPNNSNDAAIAHAIVTLAHQLRMRVSAEGVESAAQAAFLAGSDCDELQGNYLGPAVPVSQAETFFGPVEQRGV